MKIRYGFVSNSSSSSFLINKSVLTLMQIFLIKNHKQIAEKMIEDGCNINFGYTQDSWNIKETDDTISGDVFMDNFDMHTYLTQVVSVKEDDINWD